MPQSFNDNTFVESRPPISKLVNGMVNSASWTKNNNSANDTKNAIFMALLENTPNENILSSCERQFMTLNSWNIINTDNVMVCA